MNMKEKVRKELYARLAEGKHLLDQLSAGEKDTRTVWIFERLQVELELLLKLYDGEYDDLDDDILALADKIMGMDLSVLADGLLSRG